MSREDCHVIEVPVPTALRARTQFEKQLTKIKAGFSCAQDVYHILTTRGGVIPEDYYQIYELGAITFKAAVIVSINHKTPFYTGFVRIEFL